MRIGLRKYSFILVLISAGMCTGCLTLFKGIDPELNTDHLTPPMPIAPTAGGQADIRATLTNWNYGSGSTGQAWVSPIRHLVVYGEAMKASEIREGYKDGLSLFSSQPKLSNVSTSRHYGFGGGYYFSPIKWVPISIVGGFTRQNMQLRYRSTYDGRNGTASTVYESNYRIRTIRPWLQFTISPFLPINEPDFTCQIPLTLRLSRLIPTHYSGMPGTNRTVADTIFNTQQRDGYAQVGMGVSCRYKFVHMDLGPAFFIPGNNDPTYRSPLFAFNFSLGILLGWKKEPKELGRVGNN